jgi:hypothetical protein
MKASAAALSARVSLLAQSEALAIEGRKGVRANLCVPKTSSGDDFGFGW